MERYNVENNSQSVKLVNGNKSVTVYFCTFCGTQVDKPELGNSCSHTQSTPNRKEETTISLIKFYEDEDGREYFTHNGHILVD